MELTHFMGWRLTVAPPDQEPHNRTFCASSAHQLTTKKSRRRTWPRANVLTGMIELAKRPLLHCANDLSSMRPNWALERAGPACTVDAHMALAYSARCFSAKVNAIIILLGTVNSDRRWLTTSFLVTA